MHFAGSVTRSSMRASPDDDSATGPVVATAGVLSAPQYSEAVTVVTGPGVPLPGGPGSTRPRIRTLRRPSWRRRAWPLSRTQGSPPGATPWMVGSLGLGTLGARVDRKSVLPR